MKRFNVLCWLSLMAFAGLVLSACTEHPRIETPAELWEIQDVYTDTPNSADAESPISTEATTSPLPLPERTGGSSETSQTAEPVLSSPLLLPHLAVPESIAPGLVPPSPGLALLERAQADLADRLGLAPADVELVEIYYDDFSAGDLGCGSPKESQPSRPAMVMGQEIVLDAGDREFAYRSHGGTLMFCGLR